MPTGISQEQVNAAADAILSAGENPTVEKIRASLDSGQRPDCRATTFKSKGRRCCRPSCKTHPEDRSACAEKVVGHIRVSAAAASPVSLTVSLEMNNDVVNECHGGPAPPAVQSLLLTEKTTLNKSIAYPW